MNKYLGVKIVSAKAMKLGAYNEYRGWTIPENEDPELDGYLVEYEDGSQSWIPATVFDKAYHKIDALPFSAAIEAVKSGKKIARAGWNGKGMFVVYQKAYPQGIPCNKQTADAWGMKEGELFRCEPYLQLKMVNGSHSMWVPSINDVLAEDWTIVE